MKLFNWVHRRFHHHHPLPKDESAQMVERASDATSYNEKEIMKIQADGAYDKALLKKTVLVDALDGWKDGILAIGTFGFEPKEYLVLESHYHGEEDDDDDQINPDFSLSGSDAEDPDSSDDWTDSEGEEENPLMMVQGDCLKKADDDGHDAMCHHDEIVDSADEYDDDDTDDDDSYCKKQVGRTTLADLFLADADGNKNNRNNNNNNKNKKFCSGAKLFGDEDDLSNCDKKKFNLLKTKKGLSFVKKLISKVKEDTGPVKNVQQLMKRMLKRKIHPELLDVKTQKSTVGIELVSNAAPEKAASEYVSLLGLQGVPSEM